MKATIESVEFVKERDGKYGQEYIHRVKYDGKEGIYFSKKKDQDKFVAGQVAEFEEQTFNGDRGEWIKIKPIYNKNFNPASRQINREQARYSAFAVSYVKDLIIADKVKLEDWKAASEKIFRHMVDLDKTLEQ